MAKNNVSKNPSPVTPQKSKSIPFTEEDLDGLTDIGCSFDLLMQLAGLLEGADETIAMQTAVKLSKDAFWVFYYGLSDRMKEGTA